MQYLLYICIALALKQFKDYWSTLLKGKNYLRNRCLWTMCSRYHYIYFDIFLTDIRQVGYRVLKFRLYCSLITQCGHKISPSRCKSTKTTQTQENTSSIYLIIAANISYEIGDKLLLGFPIFITMIWNLEDMGDSSYIYISSLTHKATILFFLCNM